MHPDTQFAEYELLEKLGEGGMGAVYKALHTKLKRTVAIKVLPKDRLKDEQAVARFEREMAAVGSLDHPNIVRAYDAREIEGTRFLVMECVEGVDLNTLGRTCHPLRMADACEIVRQAALGLQHAHEHGLVHRDVKPSNLMITPQGVVKLLDLGLARFERDQGVGDEVTGTGQAMGTIDYMAPEQVSDSRSVDIRADIYSLGCTLYKLVAGRTPFGGPEYKSIVKKLMAHCQDPVPPVGQFRPDVPPELVRVLDRMLAKDAASRFQTPAQVANAVGPMAAAGNLPALVARAQGHPVPEAPPVQATVPTRQLGSSSGFTRLIEQIVGPSGPSERHTSGRTRRLSPRMAAVLSLLAVGVACFAAALIWGGYSRTSKDIADSGRIDPGGQAARVNTSEKTYLVLQWPLDQRDGASLELDGQTQDMERLGFPSLGGEISLPITPGEHKVVLKRLGYEPFGQSFTVTQGKDLKVRPAWKELSPVAQPPVAGQTSPPSSPATSVAHPPSTVPALADEKKGMEQAAIGKPAQPGAAAPQEKAQVGMPVLREDPEAKRQEDLAARFTKETDSVEKLTAAWDFRGAAAELRNVRFEEKELQDRVAQRRDELKRMHDLKQKIIAKINESQSPLKKSALAIKGLGGDVVKADDAGITCKLINGKTELLGWGDLGPKSTPKLAQLAVDRTNADDWIAAGLWGLVCRDPMFAERSFEQAGGLGANIDSYLTPLATAALAQATDLLEEKRFAEAAVALDRLETKYVAIAWFHAKQKAIAALRARAKGEAQEAEAEQIYAEAAGLFAKKELYDLKPLVEKLKADYSNTRPVLDRDRKPPFAEMEKGVAKIGKRLTVRLDGKGHFRTIQAAVDAANIGDLVEIEDSGPYSESVTVSAEKSGLTLRGAKGTWPLLISAEPNSVPGPLISVKGPNTTVQRMVLVNLAAVGRTPHCLSCDAANLKVEALMAHQSGAAIGIGAAGSQFNNCMIVGTVGHAPSQFQNCFVTNFNIQGPPSEVRTCTIQSVDLVHAPIVFADCILGDVKNPTRAVGHRIDHCVTFGEVSLDIERGQGCLSANPMFRDPANLDYRLMPGSPCIGKASDGGDIGCRYTPEMIELCKQALELRRRGILKF